MIIKGASRAGAGGLAKHLQRTDTNELVSLREVRGLLADDLPGALHEMAAVAAGARCKAFMYHAQINPKATEHLTPEQWQQAVDTLEKNLGLEGHQRVVVEHVKEDRQHYHIVWNRLDVETLKAVSMSWNYRTHEQTARQLEKEFQLDRVQGVHVEKEEGKTRGADTPERWEFERGKKSGIYPRHVKAEVTELWNNTTTGAELAAALEQHGYILAKGDRRDFCIIDSAGDYHSLAKRIDGAKTAEIRERMKDVDREGLPTVAQAQEIQHERQQQLEQEKAEQLESSDDFQKGQTADRLERMAKSMEEEADAPSGRPSVSSRSAIKAPLGVAGRVAESLADVAMSLLEFFGGSSRQPTPQERINSAEARRAYYQEKAAEAKRAQALENIRDDIKRGHDLTEKDLLSLSRDDLEAIRAQGDAALMKIIRLHEEKEKEKALDQERGRHMER